MDEYRWRQVCRFDIRELRSFPPDYFRDHLRCQTSSCLSLLYQPLQMRRATMEGKGQSYRNTKGQRTLSNSLACLSDPVPNHTGRSVGSQIQEFELKIHSGKGFPRDTDSHRGQATSHWHRAKSSSGRWGICPPSVSIKKAPGTQGIPTGLSL